MLCTHGSSILAPQLRNRALCYWVMQVFLVFGKSGWIGGLVGDLIKQQGAKFEYATARLEDRAGVLADVERVKNMSSRTLHCELLKLLAAELLSRADLGLACLFCRSSPPTYSMQPA